MRKRPRTRLVRWPWWDRSTGLRKIVFHIGIHRTGTTALQRALAQGREALEHAGITYPGTDDSHATLAQAMHEHGIDAGKVARWLRRNCAGTAETAILSCEDFTRVVDMSAIAGLGKRHDLSCIVYLRRQDDWLSSWYAENIYWPWEGGHWNLSPSQFLQAWSEGAFHWLDYRSLIARWAAVVGAENMIVRVMGMDALKDTTADFMEQAGLPALPVPAGPQNASPPAVILPLLARFGPGTLESDARSKLVNALQSAAAELGLTDSRQMFSPAARRHVREHYAASNAALAREWFGRDTLFDEQDSDCDYVDLETLDTSALANRVWPRVTTSATGN